MGDDQYSTYTCSKCNQTKLVSEFHRDKTAKRGRRFHCALCVGKYQAERRAQEAAAKPAKDPLPEGFKRCPKCASVKPLPEFSKDRNRADGLRGWCKKCHSASNKASYRRDPLKKRAQNGAWKAKNPGYMVKYAADYYQRNREKCDQATKDWYKVRPEVRRRQSLRDYYRHRTKRQAAHRNWQQNNQSAMRMMNARWRKNNPSLVKSYRVARKARMRGAQGSHTAGDLREIWVAQRGKCAYCRKRLPKVGYHVDHIIPISKGGSNDRRNLQLTCEFCNLSKKDRDPLVFARLVGRLL